MDENSSLDRFFGITARGSNLRTEVKGGILVFLAMVYIIAVNSGMMTAAGVDSNAAFSATIIMAVIGSLAMGLYARYPVAMAPGMGINALVCYTAVLGMGFSWSEALVAVFIAGLVFFLVTVTGIRQKLLDKIPYGIKAGIVAGIGCFIAFIGLQGAKIIVSNSSTLVGIGDLAEPVVLLGIFCIVITVFLVARKVSAGILIGMIATAIIGMAAGLIDIPSSIFATPAAPPVGEFLNGLSSNLLSIDFLMVVVALAFVEFFDGSGTLIAIGKRAGFTDEEGNVTCEKALSVDAGFASLSGVIGCTPATAFAESAVGIEAGARTGLVPVIVAILFAACLFIAPLFGVITSSCTVGAMVLVGFAMAMELKHVDWDDMPLVMGVITTILMMVLTYSITDGFALGVIVYCLGMIGSRRAKEVSPIMYGLAVIFAIYLLAYAIQFS